MLSRRDLSEGEIRSKLLARDFAEREIEDAVFRLRQRRYLDDQSLATQVVRTQARTKHQGPLKVRAYLNRRQIPETLAREAVRAEFSEGVEIEYATLTLRRLERSSSVLANSGSTGGRDPRERKKMAARFLRRLVARGYSWDAARRAVLDVHPVLETGDPEVPE